MIELFVCCHCDLVPVDCKLLEGGVSLFYAAEGAGKPVILLHGNGGSHNDLETTQR